MSYIHHPVRPPELGRPRPAPQRRRRSHLPAAVPAVSAPSGRVAAQRTESSPMGPATRGAAQRSCRIATEEPDPPTLGRPMSQGVSLMPASVAKRPVAPDPGAAGGHTGKSTEHTCRLQCGAGRLDAG
jgi:hypothetical protein